MALMAVAFDGLLMERRNSSSGVLVAQSKVEESRPKS